MHYLRVKVFELLAVKELVHRPKTSGVNIIILLNQ